MFFFATAGPANGQAPSPAKPKPWNNKAISAEPSKPGTKITEANPKMAAAFASLAWSSPGKEIRASCSRLQRANSLNPSSPASQSNMDSQDHKRACHERVSRR